LKAPAIHAAKDRVAVITPAIFGNRTGDEIHTSMKLAHVNRKGKMKQATWMALTNSRNREEHIVLEPGFARCGRKLVKGHVGHAGFEWLNMLNRKSGSKSAVPTPLWVPIHLTAATLQRHAIIMAR